ncbi:HPr family phosphocarrier protein [Streptomyces sp. NBC_01198]|uniref:HPr family phosphocarrier protein n=1 Tax=Streptomyces sp. NBC_01198 TaxID=2903769 RepID=UPI002E0E547C|nr:HPr family phosphocarrier protein [Streptomyces sp. NBC_01198]
MSPNSETGASTTRYESTVQLPADLHARPAGRLARAAAGFTSTLRLEHAGRTATPAGVLSVMALGATAGSTVTVSAEGPDALEAVTALAAILAAGE